MAAKYFQYSHVSLISLLLGLPGAPLCSIPHHYSVNLISVLPLTPAPDPMGLPALQPNCWNWRWMAAKYFRYSHVSLIFLLLGLPIIPLCCFAHHSSRKNNFVLLLTPAPYLMGLPALQSKCWNWRWMAAKYLQYSCVLLIFLLLGLPVTSLRLFPRHFFSNLIPVLLLTPAPDPMGLPALQSKCWNWRWMVVKYFQCSRVLFISLLLGLPIAPLCSFPHHYLINLISVLPLTPAYHMGLPSLQSKFWNWM